MTMQSPSSFYARHIVALLAVLALALAGPAPAVTQPPGAFVEVAAGEAHACGRLATGGVQCWGSNASGQLGNNSFADSALPVNVVGIAVALQVTAGLAHSCARLSDNTLRCWGNNGNGQLGNNSTTTSPVPVPVNLITGATWLSAGDNHNCARLIAGNGSVHCWGANADGQLGDASFAQRLVPVPTAAGTGTTSAVFVTAGANHSCARNIDGTVRCWGLGTNGRLGNGVETGSNSPITVDLVTTATNVSAGAAHTCARLADGSLRCWGLNASGRLGDGTTTQRLQPTTVVPISGISAATVDSGSSHTCATFTDGSTVTVRCWGDGALGQLGAGVLTGSLTPVPVVGIANPSGVSAGNGFSCAVLTGGSVKCWGSGSLGRLGNGIAGADVRTATLVMPATCTMDIDGDGLVLGTTDAVLLARATMGLSGAAVTQNAVVAGAPRTEWVDVRAYLATVCGMNGLAP